MENITETFNWQFEQTAKTEYYRWYDCLTRALSSHKLVFVLSQAGIDRARPVHAFPVLPADATAEDQREFRKYNSTFLNETKKFYQDCEAAMGIIRKTFTYGCKASMEAIRAYETNPDALIDPTGARWTPDRQVRAALVHLESYAPRTVADGVTLKRLLTELTDLTDGFSAYAQEFTRLLIELDKAGARPGEAELSQLVIRSIKNPQVSDYIVQRIITRDNPQPHYEEIFLEVEFYLKNLLHLGKDPYKTVTSGATGATLTSSAMMANTQEDGGKGNLDDRRCSRCWRSGHFHRTCTETSCSQCRGSLNGLNYCRNVDTHKDHKTRYKPRVPIERNPKRKPVDQEQVDKAEKEYKALAAALEKQKKRRNKE